MSGAGRIKVLPEKLANKIAAGEVVERPASVVKELVENSLDAGAGVIRIEVEGGGRNLIRVTDDGLGMSPDEALLSLERHATSKISTDEDLFAISTLGFRGEALPSIASVCRFELLTRSRERDEGVRIKVEGGTIESVEPAGCAPGTVISVRNLFFNVPARRKFLRSYETELSHITDVVQRIALSYHAAHFQLLNDGREVIETPPAPDRRGRIADTLGLSTLERMREVHGELDSDHLIRGFVSLPDLNRATGSNIFVYVNNRFIRDRLINHAIMEAFRGFLPKGRYPVVALFIEVPAHEVDVNVHPSKAEVRFRESGRIHDFIRSAVLSAFDKTAHETPSPKPVAFASPEPPAEPSEHEQKIRDALVRSVAADNSPQSKKVLELVAERRPPTQRTMSLPRPPQEIAHMEPSPSAVPIEEHDASIGYFSTLKVLGQLKTTYVVCQSQEGLVLIDQHAAHERTAFERLKKEHAAKRIQRQSLLFPETLELGLKESREMNRFRDVISSLGFDIEPFGGKAFLVRALPAILGAADPRALVLDLLEALAQLRSTSALEDRLDDVFARLSCHAVVRAGRALGMDEMHALLHSLDNADYPLTCPHGRPICVRITYEELERMFGRR